MRLTTKGRYAVTAMLDLALQENGKPVILATIAERQNISLPYLEQLFALLRKAELVSSIRGPGGGYMLNRASKDITVADVITAVDEQVDATRCHGLENCIDDSRCITHDLWEQLSTQIHDFLAQVDLAKLVENHDNSQHHRKHESNHSSQTVDFTAHL